MVEQLITTIALTEVRHSKPEMFSSNLLAGNYDVLVTDANGCTASTNEILTDAPAPVVQNVNATNVNCNGAGNGQLTITANGGTNPLQYSIDNGISFQGTTSFTNLTPGNYIIQVSDANGCTITSNATISEPTVISFNTN